MEPNHPNILANLTKYVKEELALNNIPPDHTYAVVAGVNNEGVKIMATVNIKRSDRIQTNVAAVWEHDWDGDDTASLKLVLSGK